MEKQSAHFYSVDITEKQAKMGLVCRVHSNDKSKFKVCNCFLIYLHYLSTFLVVLVFWYFYLLFLVFFLLILCLVFLLSSVWLALNVSYL